MFVRRGSTFCLCRRTVVRVRLLCRTLPLALPRVSPLVGRFACLPALNDGCWFGLPCGSLARLSRGWFQRREQRGDGRTRWCITLRAVRFAASGYRFPDSAAFCIAFLPFFCRALLRRRRASAVIFLRSLDLPVFLRWFWVLPLPFHCLHVWFTADFASQHACAGCGPLASRLCFGLFIAASAWVSRPHCHRTSFLQSAGRDLHIYTWVHHRYCALLLRTVLHAY